MRLVAAAAIAVAMSLAVASGAHASKAVHVSCGETITGNTKLANDLIDCPGVGIVIGADDITLDLNGHTVDGDGVADFEGVQVIGHDRITIKGGLIRDFVEGVAVIDGRSATLRELSVANSRHVGLFVIDSANIQMRSNSVVDTDFAGIFVARSHSVQIERNASSRNGAGINVADSDGVGILGNSVSENGFAGIIVESDGTAVRRNLVSSTGLGIIVFASHSTITDNHIADAVGCLPVSEAFCVNPPPGPCSDCVEGFGISVEGGAANVVARNDVIRTRLDGVRIGSFEPELNPTTDTIVRDNRVRNATVDGFSIATEVPGSVTGTLLSNNVAVGSGDDGFDVRSASATLTKNTANRNHDFGIDAVVGVIDGGGNRARANGNPLQCANVVCR